MPGPGFSLSHPLRVTRLSAKAPTTFDLAPDSAARAALAADLGISAIDAMTFRGTLTPVGRKDFTLQADLAARVVQPCVVTLQPVTTTLRDTVLRRFARDYQEPTGDEVELEDDTVEPLPDVIDIGAVAAEALALALPDYPRIRGAVFATADLSESDLGDSGTDRPKPFAGLADLAAKLALKAPKDGEKG